MQCDGDSCAGGRGIRSCHSGIGRSCYHHGHRACPAHHSVSIPYFLKPMSPSQRPSRSNRALPLRRRVQRIFVPFQGRSSRRRRYRRRYACWLLRMYPPTVLVIASSTTQIVRGQELIVVGLVTLKSREFPSVCEPLSGSLSR
jgi:hypothetical protein